VWQGSAQTLVPTAKITMKTPARAIIVMRSIMITGSSPGG